MKLYFYILDSDREYNPETRKLGDYIFKLRVEECEMIEMPKTYRPLTKILKKIYTGYVKKEDVGRISGHLTPYIALIEPNYQFAKEAFLKRYNDEICRLKNTIAMYEKKITAVEAGEENCK